VRLSASQPLSNGGGRSRAVIVGTRVAREFFRKYL
jgi:hypothetical protein